VPRLFIELYARVDVDRLSVINFSQFRFLEHEKFSRSTQNETINRLNTITLTMLFDKKFLKKLFLFYLNNALRLTLL